MIIIAAVKMLAQQFLIRRGLFVRSAPLNWSYSDVSVAETEELVERGAMETEETALHRPTQVSPTHNNYEKLRSSLENR